VQLACIALLLSVALQGTARGAPITADDSFEPACGGVLPSPSPGQWKALVHEEHVGGRLCQGWGPLQGQTRHLLACGQAVIVDVPSVDVTVLSVLGALMFKDDASLPNVTLTAAFVIVEGRFSIGTSEQQFSQQATIVLKANPNNRRDYWYTSRQPADTTYPRNLGHKAFAVVGGQVDFHGLPGPASMLTWTRLAATAREGRHGDHGAGATCPGGRWAHRS